MKIIDFPQGTLEWLKARAGMVTASRIADVVAKTKTGESASRANYRAQIVAERLSGQPQESYTNDAMRWGIDTEPLARSAYEAHTGDFVEQIGLVLHPEI
ncbi:MAG TPA: YqaJ viral recombinase family protein, partial [Vitreimonas sp.]|nr:YqaJ viral recombinase family protein [Vitreimonas sp.]